ncbi:MAG: ECF transporter S component [Anaerolineae bacterium]|nr:ECF transporter S component [Anaerolineae bacterium]
MPNNRIRKIVITGALGAISVVLGVTRWGFIPWVSGASLTVMHIPVIIGAVLEGPVVGTLIGLIFGVSSLLQAAINPISPTDPWFVNPLLSVLPRLFIGPVSWLVYNALKKSKVLSIIAAGLAGSLTNTVLVLGMIGVLGYAPFAVLAPIVVLNGLPEAVVSAIITLAVVAAWQQIEVGKKGGSNI